MTARIHRACLGAPAVRISLASLVALVSLLALGCTATRAERPSRYVGDPADLAGLERIRATPFDELFVRPGVDWRALQAVRLGSVTLAEKVEMHGERYTRGELERLRRSFEVMLGRGLGRGIDVVLHDGPGVVVIDAVLTEAVANVSPEHAARRGRSIGIGSAAMQLRVRDSQTGQIWIAIVDRYVGEDLSTNPTASFTWGDAQAAFRVWARQLLDLLLRERERSAA